MASATFKSYKHLLLILILVFPISVILSKSVVVSSSSYGERIGAEQRKKVLGSRPPACINKCSSCRPCMATLVIPPHQTKSHASGTTNYRNRKFYNSNNNEDDTYYLLSWKCKCGDKVFQP